MLLIDWELNDTSIVPRIDFYKWAIDSRWMSHGCQRWAKSHTVFLLTSFFNAVGFVPWENGASPGCCPLSDCRQ